MIQSGRVRVNGRVAAIGDGAEAADTVELDGAPVELPAEHVHLALNKPAGYLTTLRDEPGKRRPTVVDLVPKTPGLVPVGRLDAETTGLLLFTNDGGLANRITHPSREVEKEYLVTVSGSVPDSAFERLAAGPELDDGPMTPPELEGVRRSRTSTTFRLTIHEGRNRIIRRACTVVGLEVIGLSRLRVGPVELGGLGPGEYRSLDENELERLP
jgi:23S rRNA pseudouridine2605 synthase